MFSGGLYLESLPQVEDATVDRACALNPRGMSGVQCRAMTRIPARNLNFCCGNSDHAPCTSKDRLCRACVMHSGEKSLVIDSETGLCAFHTERGADVPQTWTGYQKVVPSVTIARTQKPAPAQRTPDVPAPSPVRNNTASHRITMRRHVDLYASLRNKLSAPVMQMLEDKLISYRQACRLASRYPNLHTRQELLAWDLIYKKITLQDI